MIMCAGYSAILWDNIAVGSSDNKRCGLCFCSLCSVYVICSILPEVLSVQVSLIANDSSGLGVIYE